VRESQIYSDFRTYSLPAPFIISSSYLVMALLHEAEFQLQATAQWSPLFLRRAINLAYQVHCSLYGPTTLASHSAREYVLDARRHGNMNTSPLSFCAITASSIFQLALFTFSHSEYFLSQTFIPHRPSSDHIVSYVLIPSSSARVQSETYKVTSGTG
jgi:hypothetical protein